MEYEPYRIECSWCKAHLSGPKNTGRVSHGICEPCLKEQMASITGDVPDEVLAGTVWEPWQDLGGES